MRQTGEGEEADQGRERPGGRSPPRAAARRAVRVPILGFTTASAISQTTCLLGCSRREGPVTLRYIAQLKAQGGDVAGLGPNGRAEA